MARGRAYRRFRARVAKKRAEALYLIWRCDIALAGEPEAVYRKRCPSQLDRRAQFFASTRVEA